MITFQEIVTRLSHFWKEKGCIIHQGYDLEVGAGTFNPATFLRCLGPEPYHAAYIEPSRRPADGRYGKNPNRLQHYFQYQTILKPSPPNIQDLYLQSLKAIGFDLQKHDIRFVHDDWESPTLGAWGLGWEVWMDGMEVTQFTYFQSVGGVNLTPVTGELTYGIERLAMYLQNVDSIFDLQWNEQMTYGDIYHRNEVEWSHYNFESARVEMWQRHFEDYEIEATQLMEANLPLPAYDFVMKASHAFNMLDARGAISVTERTGYIARIRNLSCSIAQAYVKSREEQKFPLLRHLKKSELPAVPLIEKTAFNPEVKRDFVLEIGSEELPATFVPIGSTNLKRAIEQLFKSEAVAHGEVRVMGTPRRLTVMVSDLAEGKKEQKEERRGPPLKAAFDGEGKPTKAGCGFFRSLNKEPLSLSEIEAGKDTEVAIRSYKNSDYLFGTLTLAGLSTIELLAERLPKLILNLDFPKKMRWGDLDISYARPLRWILALFGDSLIPFVVGDVTTSKTSWGHSQLFPLEFKVSHPDEYLSQLKEHKVMVDIDERRSCILDQIKEIEKESGFCVIEKERVIPQVLHLVEWPMLTTATFDPHFLKAPAEVLISEMVEHQKYFPVADKEGKLTHYFVITANNSPSDEIRHGNVKVLSARLSDGVFLYENDLKEPLETLNEKLKAVTFQKELGSVFDKVERIVSNVEVLHKHLPIAELEKAKRAAWLCKSDLASELVGEFPDLQGVVGKLYAIAGKEDAEVALAIDEHWMPRGERAPLPTTPSGLLVSLADKIDNLLCCFSAGLKPTSSSDPYALRRQVLGIIKMLIEAKLTLPVMEVFEECQKNLAKAAPEAIEEIKAFFTNRIKTVFVEYGLEKDEIEASLSSGFSDIYDSFCRAQALHKFRASNENFPLLYEVFKRAKGQIGKQKPLPFSERLLVEDAEKKLYFELKDIEHHLNIEIESRCYDAAYALLSNIQQPLARLFDEVRVLSDDEKLKNNRIALLQRVFYLFSKLLDFSKIQEKDRVTCKQ